MLRRSLIRAGETCAFHLRAALARALSRPAPPAAPPYTGYPAAPHQTQQQPVYPPHAYPPGTYPPAVHPTGAQPPGQPYPQQQPYGVPPQSAPPGRPFYRPSYRPRMRLPRGRWGKVAAVAGVLVLVPPVALLGAYWWMRAQQPQTSGSVAIPGDGAPAEVVRDKQGVVHIFAATERDAYRALGYAHAQDRLWQMETMRRAGAGRLAELIGTKYGDFALRTDRLMRMLGIRRAAEAMAATLSPDARTAFEAYAEGVNAYLATRSEALPVEFQLLRHTPEPWTVADSLVWAKLMALQLSANYRDELFRSRVLERLSPQQLDDLFPPDAPGSPTTLASDLRGMDMRETVRRTLAALPQMGFDTASNEWVLTGARTTTGKPILANDPHLALEAPILWYLARIVTPGFTVTGATVPGVPLTILGHNGKVAWGFTTTHSDTQDLFVEKPDPQDPARYLTPDGSQQFETRAETIAIAGEAPQTLTVRSTRHGPVISDLDVAPAGGTAPVLALSFPGLADDDTSAEALYRLNHAGSAEGVRDALRLHVAPQQNIVYADVTGEVGFITAGRVPIRRKGDGRVPVPGWAGEYDWTGFLPYYALPQAVNPPTGQFVNANNAVVGRDYPYRLATEWPDPSRAKRIVEMLGNGRHSVEDVARQQMDIVSLPARDFLPELLKYPTPPGLASDAAALLRGWDGRMDRNRPEPLIFTAWLRELVRAVFADELGPDFASYWDLRPEPLRHVLKERPEWCDDVTTPQKESCADMIGRSLETAVKQLAERHGSSPKSWRWGDDHTVALVHRMLSRVPLIGGKADLSVETDGDFFTVNRGSTTIRDPGNPFRHVQGAGFRAVYDLADLDNSRFVIATGQSGNIWSRHWGDLVELWRDGGSLRLAGDRGTLVSAGAEVLTLTPRNTGTNTK
ncbi:penicillin amidase [Azospirillum lipoferum]|uniref:Penicillin acylase family protein n=1 Tax=Azospirillum lipoferum TaxID=193 RepID=A0A5A9GGT2_AZOLI|nr:MULTISPECIES: penicillin acylase family protein [Azospirillum]KAA0593537.1 penicillin acylase family protein [Azospirillum lipoferum]MCP1608997.1 penicillin amidase [Azospirillum lipoferum]MDW5535690.1 penicillin acylase family protein [Azospirillum sp. NL1]